MTKSEFCAFVNYLRNRPEAVLMLREVLEAGRTEAAAREDGRWLSPSEAGRLIGRSSRWVRANIGLFETARRVQRGSRTAWLVQAGDVRDAYNVWRIEH